MKAKQFNRIVVLGKLKAAHDLLDLNLGDYLGMPKSETARLIDSQHEVRKAINKIASTLELMIDEDDT